MHAKLAPRPAPAPRQVYRPQPHAQLACICGKPVNVINGIKYEKFLALWNTPHVCRYSHAPIQARGGAKTQSANFVRAAAVVTSAFCLAAASVAFVPAAKEAALKQFGESKIVQCALDAVSSRPEVAIIAGVVSLACLGRYFYNR